jgi:hypothetical protein
MRTPKTIHISEAESATFSRARSFAVLFIFCGASCCRSLDQREQIRRSVFELKEIPIVPFEPRRMERIVRIGVRQANAAPALKLV